MFTSPELGRIGMSEGEARKSGERIKVGKRTMAESGKARELGKTDGFVKSSQTARRKGSWGDRAVRAGLRNRSAVRRAHT